MNPKISSLTVGLALLAGAAVPAGAADWNYGGNGLKDYAPVEHGIPVPAPVPVPDYEPEWYLRADVGYNFSSSGDVSSTFNARRLDTFGNELQLTGIAPTPIALDDLEGQGVFSFGFGRYLSRNFRLELTGERRLHQRIVEPTFGQAIVQSDERAGDLVAVLDQNGDPTPFEERQLFDNHIFEVNRNDRTELGSYMLMANAFYDFEGYRGFRPYVGAGIGLVVHSLNRDYSERAVCRDRVEFYEDEFGDVQSQSTQGNCVLPESDVSTSGGDDTTGFGLGLSLMAGVGWEIRDGLHWDIGYRYVYQDGSVALVADTFNGESIVKVEGRHDHEIRTGIRFDIQ